MFRSPAARCAAQDDNQGVAGGLAGPVENLLDDDGSGVGKGNLIAEVAGFVGWCERAE